MLCGRLPFNAFAGLSNINKLVREQYVVLMLVLPAAFLGGLYAAIRGRIGGLTLDKAERLLLGYIVLNIGFVGLLAVLFEIAETSRMRFMTDPLSLVLLGFLAQHAIIRCNPKRGTN